MSLTSSWKSRRKGTTAALMAGAALLVLAGAGWAQDPPALAVVDANLQPISKLTVGDTLFVGVNGLQPDTSYQVRLSDEKGVLVSYYQLTASLEGNIEPAALWYHTGVDGCAHPERKRSSLYSFWNFQQAEEALKNRTFTLALFDGKDQSLARQDLPLVIGTTPRVYFSDATGCLMNAFQAGTGMVKDDVYLTIENLDPSKKHELQAFVVPNRYGWNLGMPLDDARLRSPKGDTFIVEAGRTRFTALLWPATETRAGSYDLVVRSDNKITDAVLQVGDRLSYQLDTGTVLQFAYDPPCPLGGDFDIAGRPVLGSGYPFFEFHDVFEEGETMWGALDPAYVPAGHPGGDYAAYYVIADGSQTAGLTDVSGNIEVVRVKNGCINGSMVPIWNSPTVGTYDVVIDFGSQPAGTMAQYQADNTFNAGLDFIDRSTDTGAVVVKDPALPGPATVNSWSYAPAPANPADPLWTDVSSYFNTPSFGVPYAMNKVPLHGEVRYPSGAGPFPLVLVVHGNSSAATASDQGYFYLLDLLASHGMIAVSVDENFLNGGVFGEMDARAIVLLRHLQRWRTWNATAAHPFFGKVDMNKIGLAGHSRGGEAVTVAWLFNTTRHNAADPNHDFNFNLKSLYAIAPVDSQVEQSYTGMPVTLRNVDYYVMHGSHDGDVYTFEGQKTFDRADPVTLSTIGMKGLLYVYGANHNFWNTVWTASPDAPVNPTADLISAAQQQSLGKAYVSAFFRYGLKGETAYRSLFTSDVAFPSLPAAVTRVTQYQDPARLFLNHYEEDVNTATGSYTGLVNANNLLSPFQESSFGGGASNPFWLWGQSRGLIAGWNNSTARYDMTFPAAIGNPICSYPYLSFRVGQVYEPTPNLNPLGQAQDFFVRLQLGPASSHALRVANFNALPYPKVTSRFTSNVTKTVPQTVRMPLPAFLVNNTTSLDLRDLTKIEFLFNQTPSGLVAIDEIQLTK
jgi:hypothetical protein